MIEKKEDYFVNGNFTYESSCYEQIPCKIYLPETIYDKPKIVVRSSSRSARAISSHWKLSLEAEVIGYDKAVNTRIKCPEVYTDRANTSSWGVGVEETTISYSAENLEVISLLKHSDSSKSSIEFWVTSNSFITPPSIVNQSYDGNVEVKVSRNISHNVNEVTFDFLNRYKYAKNASGDMVQSTYLTGRCEHELCTIDTESIISNYLSELDDFLLLTSFASRHRTVCVGWDKYDSDSHVKFFRGNYSIPKKKTNDINDALIDIASFDFFIGKAIKNFDKYEDKQVIRSAIFSLLSSSESSLEKSFLSKFAALESLVLVYKRSEGVEFILTSEDWKILRKQLEKSIRQCDELALTKAQRASIYLKLGELNRLSLKESFEKFSSHYSLFCSDLWPIFGSDELSGLSDIRNKLIHGDPLPRNLFGALITANFHLSIYLERVLTVILGWSVENTNVSLSRLRMFAGELVDFHSDSKTIKVSMTNS
ncbi:hypothetical protein ACEWBM_22135 [Vibrio parahaemolyticus]